VQNSLLTLWPGEPALIGLRREAGAVSEAFRYGPVAELRSWASVSKSVASIEFALAQAENPDLGKTPAGPLGSTLAHLLSHSSGLGFEESAPTAPVGTKRVYSNWGIDLAVKAMSNEDPATKWQREIFKPLGMSASLEGRPSAGVVGSCEDLAKLAAEWLHPVLMAEKDRDEVRQVNLPELNGVVPGFGRFEPCWWGLGVELRGQKNHWMGDWAPLSFGHFGQSGAFLLVNVEEGIALVATSSVEFGPWASELWGSLTSAARDVFLDS
jgi:CubicO group peptidase (beta-lactamase class C family)